MPQDTEEVKPEAAPKSTRLPFSVSEAEEQDLVRRNAEWNLETGKHTSLQEFVRHELWPNGSPVAS